MDLKSEIQQQWESIREIGQRLWQRGLIAANDGNISVRLSNGNVLCTPSGISKGFLGAEDFVVTSPSGTKLSGQREPSSELKMHIAVYAARQDIKAVTHAHPPHATAFAVAGEAVPPNVMPEIDVLLGHVDLLPYAKPGTQDLAEGVRRSANAGTNAILLSNHGATTWGENLQQAWLRMESLDHCCKILLEAKILGEWRRME